MDRAHVVAILYFSKRCGASNPNSLTESLLWNQIAILSQMLVMKEDEIHQLAYYRTPEINTHFTKLSEFFMWIGDIDPSKYRGKTIEDLESPEEVNI